MNITFTLADPEKCEGCPCKVLRWNGQLFRCALGYWDESYLKRHVKRPAKCIAEHGR